MNNRITNSFGAAACAAVLALTAPVLTAAEARPSTPVTVDGVVSVQGVVDVINDVLRTPYVRNASATGEGPSVNFDIPDGKRLIIESIAFQASRLTVESNRMFLQPLLAVNAARPLVPLPVQFEAVEGSVTYMISMVNMTGRFDAVAGSTSEIQVRRGVGSSPNATLNVTVFGYLVDKAQ